MAKKKEEGERKEMSWPNQDLQELPGEKEDQTPTPLVISITGGQCFGKTFLRKEVAKIPERFCWDIMDAYRRHGVRDEEMRIVRPIWSPDTEVFDWDAWRAAQPDVMEDLRTFIREVGRVCLVEYSGINRAMREVLQKGHEAGEFSWMEILLRPPRSKEEVMLRALERGVLSERVLRYNNMWFSRMNRQEPHWQKRAVDLMTAKKTLERAFATIRKGKKEEK